MTIKTRKLNLWLKFFIFTSILFFPILSASINDNNSQSTKQIPVIFDEAHINPNDLFSIANFDHEGAMNKSLEIIKQLDIDGDLQQDYNVSINSDYFTKSYFDDIGPQGILIMTLLDKKIGLSEGKAIRNWVENGGSVFISTQPDYAGFRYAKTENTNSLLKSLNLLDKFKLYQFEDPTDGINSDELFDDNASHLLTINNVTPNPWDIVVTKDQFTDNEFGNAIKQGIDKVLLGVSSIVTNQSEVVGAYSWPESYSVSDVTGEKRLLDEAIPWIVGTNLGQGKVVLLGSTFPISSWQLYGTTISFIDQLDNKRLWINIISWLADTNIQPAATTTSSTSTIESTSQSAPDDVKAANGFLLNMMLLSFVLLLFFRKKRKNGSI